MVARWLRKCVEEAFTRWQQIRAQNRASNKRQGEAQRKDEDKEKDKNVPKGNRQRGLPFRHFHAATTSVVTVYF